MVPRQHGQRQGNMTEIDTASAPTLPALDAGNGQLRVWCAYCKRYHLHGGGGGHRVAHCDKVTPYSVTGYILEIAKGGKP